MTLKHAISLPATVAGVWFLTTISPTRGQSVHGESIDTAAPTVSARPAAKSAAAGDGAVPQADFETLAAFQFNAPDAAVTNQAALNKVGKQIPENIKKLDGKVVRIRGFMMPVKESAGKATEFLITRSQPSCCFSGATGMNEFITVKSAGQGVVENMDDAVAIEGTLRVGVFTDGGFVVGLYQMDGGKMIPAGH
ncbi:MAG: DUF3299 domain-containing protein [Limisphaerales bacterium]